MIATTIEQYNIVSLRNNRLWKAFSSEVRHEEAYIHPYWGEAPLLSGLSKVLFAIVKSVSSFLLLI